MRNNWGFGGPPADDIRARAAMMKGDMAAAARICAGGKDWSQHLYLAIADKRLGRYADGNAELALLRSKFGDNGAYEYAQIYAQWGETNEALNWLETAYRLRDDGMLDMEADALVDPLRKSPRFKDIEHQAWHEGSIA